MPVYNNDREKHYPTLQSNLFKPSVYNSDLNDPIALNDQRSPFFLVTISRFDYQLLPSH